MASPYRTRYNDPYQIESDHKDIVVSQLKAEAFELRQNERDFDDLQSRVNNLNHKCNLIKEEMELDENDYHVRNEINTKTINGLRDEIDVLHSELRGIDADIQDLREENHHVKNSNSTIFAELCNLKTDIGSLEQEREALTFQNQELDKLIVRTQADMKKCESEDVSIGEKSEEISAIKAKNEATVKLLEDEIEAQLKINDELKARHDELRAQARERNINIKEAEHQLSENKKRIVVLESRIQDKKRINERLNKEIVVSQEEKEKQDDKGLQNNEKLESLEGALRNKDEELEELRRELAELRNERSEIIEGNDALNDEAKAAHKQLDTLINEHYQLLGQVEKINREDEQILAILERRQRLVKTTEINQEKLTVETNKLKESAQSPIRTASTNVEGF